MDLRSFFCVLLLVVFYVTLDPKGLKDKWQSTGSTGCILSNFMTPKSCIPNPGAWTPIIFGGIWEWASSQQYDQRWWSGPGLEQFVEASYLQHEGCTTSALWPLSGPGTLLRTLHDPFQAPPHSRSSSSHLPHIHPIPVTTFNFPTCSTFQLLSLTFHKTFHTCTPISCDLTKCPVFSPTNFILSLSFHPLHIFAQSTNDTLSLSPY